MKEIIQINLEQKAALFANEKHKGQYRKDGTTPYIRHPAAVVALLKEIGVTDENILASAWLHDVMEDCDVEEEEICRLFNSEVARIVSLLTCECDKKEYVRRINESDYAVKIVKLADVVHNCASLFIGLPESTIRNKVNECNSYYFALARETSLILYEKITHAIIPWIKKYS